ncbi:hypothetical protein AEA09_08480 [Lysinibacillus contaminans]|uniref:YndJ-like protein n=1 Tax=Lysinibacillus contaminans TaxID=1293441 RepID=A0ABR5K0W7_9BACI|nr:YndJ family protein [Lysinibacillus contaminans]KOS68582.1 hypothetical protein AEA09_08480 [Lysinibacillus contaminans]
MLVNLRNNLFSPVLLLGMVLTVVCYLFSKQPDYMMLLTIAQLLFVPAMLKMVVPLRKGEDAILVVMMIAVTMLHWWSDGGIAIVLALVYLCYTAFVALQGVKRFLQRGFTNIAEIAIDVGLVYLFVGGLWFFAFTAQIDTGFTPLITWLTGIHFHYSACLLAISVGLFGRLHQSKWYNALVVILLAGPMLVAIGITFSTIVEVVSVVLYIVAIYWLFILAMKTRFPGGQRLFLCISYGAVCVTILWSLLYAFGNLIGTSIVGIPDMLKFHGFFNCVLFGGVGVFAWALVVPKSAQSVYTFPVSKIRGKLAETGVEHPGLVDDLSDYVDTSKLPLAISHFYEQTHKYKLTASVQWSTWFKPFAFIFQGISRWMQQLNLPFSSQPIEMTGAIVQVDEQLDGRKSPRAWIRKMEGQTIFVAIYSQHTTAQTTYMNIALPLPFSTMIGVLYLFEENGELHLTSKHTEDAGIYLAIRDFLFKLPLHEHFTITATRETSMTAIHTMRIFGLPFLRIDYEIERAV